MHPGYRSAKYLRYLRASFLTRIEPAFSEDSWILLRMKGKQSSAICSVALMTCTNKHDRSWPVMLYLSLGGGVKSIGK